MLLGILGIVLGIANFPSGNALSLLPMLTALAGSVMVFMRVRAGAILLAIASGLVLLLTVLGVLHEVAGFPPYNVGFRLHLELEDDWVDLIRLLLAIAVLVLSLLPRTTAALTGRQSGPPSPPGFPPQSGYAPPPPGYSPPPPSGYGPPPQQPPRWG